MNYTINIYKHKEKLERVKIYLQKSLYGELESRCQIVVITDGVIVVNLNQLERPDNRVENRGQNISVQQLYLIGGLILLLMETLLVIMKRKTKRSV